MLQPSEYALGLWGTRSLGSYSFDRGQGGPSPPHLPEQQVVPAPPFTWRNSR